MPSVHVTQAGPLLFKQRCEEKERGLARLRFSLPVDGRFGANFCHGEVADPFDS